MRLESREQIESLEGDERERALITLHHADDNTLDRLDVTRAEVDQWITDEGITPPPLSVVGAPTLSEAQTQGLAEVRRQANEHITAPPTDPAKWPDFRQRNADALIYPLAVKEQKDKDIAATIEESNRVELLIEDATTLQEVQDALDSISFPTFPVA